MTDVNQLITEHIDIWTSAIEKKSSAGRGNSGGISLYGIQKLRELVLELAVRGKLVPQATQDGTAHNELAELERQTAKIALEGNFKRLDPSAGKPTSSGYFDLPSTWIWCSLDDVAAIARGGSPRPIKSYITDALDGVPWIKIGDSVRGSPFIERTEEKIRPDGLKKSRLVFPGDLVLSNSMSFGFPYILKLEGAIHDGWLVIRPPEGLIDKLYLQKVFLSPLAKRQFDDAASGAVVQNLNADKVRQLRIPLPPIAEQRRIVAKVDELMALCDALERQTEDSLKAHQTLVETCLATLTNSQSPEYLSQNWTRLETYFDTLFTTQQSIEQLLETAVSLAVQGKLTHQSNDEELFGSFWDRLKSSKAALARKPGVRKKKPIPEVDPNLAPFEAPESWEWVKLDDVVDISGGITKGRKLAGRKTIQFPYLRVANVQRGFLDLEEIKEITLPIDEVEKYQLQDGDLLITEGGDWDKVGRTAIWRCQTEVMGHQNHVFRARKLIPEQNENWFELYLNCSFARDYFAGSSKQTTNLASINMTQLRSCMIPMPPFEEQIRILDKVNSFRALTVQLKQSLTKPAKLQSDLADILTSQIH